MMLVSKIKTTALIAAAAVALGVFSGCGGLSQGSVARIYDVQISEAQMQKRAGMLIIPGASDEQKAGFNRSAVLQLVNEEIIRHEAAKRGLEVSEEDIQKNIDSVMELRFAGDREQFELSMAEMGVDENEVRQGLRVQLLEPLLQQAVTSEVQPSEEEIFAAYKAFVDSYGSPEWRRMSVIVVADEVLAKELKARAEGGEDFARLVSQYSIDEATKSKQGAVSMDKTRTGVLPAEVTDAAFKAESGTVAGPVKSEKGFYIVNIELVEPDKETPFELVKEQYKEKARAAKMQQVWEDFLKQAAIDASVIYRDDVKPGEKA